MFGAPETPAIDARLTIDPPRPLSIIWRLTAASTAEQAEHVDVEDTAGICERVGVDRREGALSPGAVDESADLPQRPDGRAGGALVRHVECRRADLAAAAPAALRGLCELRCDIWVVGQDHVVPRRRQTRRDGGADVAGGTGHEDGRHTVTVARRASDVSKRCTAPRSPICTLSSTAPANGAAALATSR